VIYIRLERLIFAVVYTLQKLDLFQIPAAAPVRLEFGRELRFPPPRRAHVRLPVERRLFQRSELFQIFARGGGWKLGKLLFRFASAGSRLRRLLFGGRRW
jgi:hypothetical protein